MLNWLNKSVFSKQTTPEPPPPVSTLAPEPPVEDVYMVEDLTVEMEVEYEPESPATPDGNQGNQGFFDPCTNPAPPPAAPDPPPPANRPNLPYAGPAGTEGVSERREKERSLYCETNSHSALARPVALYVRSFSINLQLTSRITFIMLSLLVNFCAQPSPSLDFIASTLSCL